MHFDYAFLRNAERENNVTVLVGRCWESNMLAAHVVPSKGDGEEWVGEGKSAQEGLKGKTGRECFVQA